MTSEILDTWVALYALSIALSLFWSLKNGFPKRSYYAVGLVSPSMQLGLALVFLGFDYSFGLSLLSASFYMAFLVVALKSSQWAASMFFAMEIVFVDGLLFWSALIGLQWSLPAQLVLIGYDSQNVDAFRLNHADFLLKIHGLSAQK